MINIAYYWGKDGQINQWTVTDNREKSTQAEWIVEQIPMGN